MKRIICFLTLAALLATLLMGMPVHSYADTTYDLVIVVHGVSGNDQVFTLSNISSNPAYVITYDQLMGWINQTYGQNYQLSSIAGVGSAHPGFTNNEIDHVITIAVPFSDEAAVNVTRTGSDTLYAFNFTCSVHGTVSDKGPEEPGVTPPCQHRFIWQTTKEPTVDSDGETVYICELCGHVEKREVLPGISVFEDEVVNKITKAPFGGTVFISTTHWNTYGRGVMEALISRQDVTLKTAFLSQGHKGIPLSVTIPTGTDIRSLFDENGYLGLCRAGSELGYDQ